MNGHEVKRRRVALGLNQKQLADRIGVSQPHVSNIENGRAFADKTTVRRLRQVLGSDAATDDESEQTDDSRPSGYGAWVNSERLKREMTVPELADKSGISVPAIYNIESGRSRNPQERTRAAIERAFGSTVELEVVRAAEEGATVGTLGAMVDFDPHSSEDWPTEAGIYVFYDVSERPIYVGEGQSIAKRVRDHEQKFWFKSPIVDSAAYVRIEDETMRKNIEAILIRFLKSNAVINKQHVRR